MKHKSPLTVIYRERARHGIAIHPGGAIQYRQDPTDEFVWGKSCKSMFFVCFVLRPACRRAKRSSKAVDNGTSLGKIKSHSKGNMSVAYQVGPGRVCCAGGSYTELASIFVVVV